MVKDKCIVNVSIPDIKDILKDECWTFMSIPTNCYTDTINTPCSELYEVFYNGEKLNDVYGIIRYSNKIDPKLWNEPLQTKNKKYIPFIINKTKKVEKKITNWQKEIEDELN